MNGKPWLPEHTAMLKRLVGFAYDHEIAKATGHCVDTVQRRRAALGFPAYHGTPVQYAFSQKALDFQSRNFPLIPAT